MKSRDRGRRDDGAVGGGWWTGYRRPKLNCPAAMHGKSSASRRGRASAGLPAANSADRAAEASTSSPEPFFLASAWMRYSFWKSRQHKASRRSTVPSGRLPGAEAGSGRRVTSARNSISFPFVRPTPLCRIQMIWSTRLGNYWWPCSLIVGNVSRPCVRRRPRRGCCEVCCVVRPPPPEAQSRFGGPPTGSRREMLYGVPRPLTPSGCAPGIGRCTGARSDGLMPTRCGRPPCPAWPGAANGEEVSGRRLRPRQASNLARAPRSLTFCRSVGFLAVSVSSLTAASRALVEAPSKTDMVSLLGPVSEAVSWERLCGVWCRACPLTVATSLGASTSTASLPWAGLPLGEVRVATPIAGVVRRLSKELQGCEPALAGWETNLVLHHRRPLWGKQGQ